MREGANLRRKVLEADGQGRAEDVCPLHGVLDLPHVSRPASGAHRLQRVALEPRDQLALDSVHLFQEVIDQKRDVVLAFTYSALPQSKFFSGKY